VLGHCLVTFEFCLVSVAEYEIEALSFALAVVEKAIKPQMLQLLKCHQVSLLTVW
jgi:hypothetical protein